MLTRPTTDQVLSAVARDLEEVVLPAVSAEPVRVAIGMMTQLVRGCAARAAHEIAWMYEEMAAIDSATSDIDDRATQTALAAFRAVPVDSVHLDDVVARYHLASEALGAAIEWAYRSGHRERASALRELLFARSAHEMQIVGALDLVGRG
jgi:hypothetical protein